MITNEQYNILPSINLIQSFQYQLQPQPQQQQQQQTPQNPQPNKTSYDTDETVHILHDLLKKKERNQNSTPAPITSNGIPPPDENLNGKQPTHLSDFVHVASDMQDQIKKLNPNNYKSLGNKHLEDD